MVEREISQGAIKRNGELEIKLMRRDNQIQELKEKLESVQIS